MKVLKEIFSYVSIKCYRIHLAQVWWRQIQKVGLSQEYKSSKSEIGMLPWNKNCPQFCGSSIDVLLKLQTINYVKIRSMDTVLPHSRVENDKDKHLLVVQKYSIGEILVNSTPVHLG